ncbi:hypothetical protein [Billgrantia antri]|uniref:hypothetical protein n=1 Tax=Billgrantia antri TaxID=2846777 RepID=UPI003B211FEF
MTRFHSMNSDTPVRGAHHHVMRWLAVAAISLALGGCMAPRPGAGLPPYGDSVRHTKAIQTYEPGDEVPQLHGAKAAEAMRVYRLPAAGGGLAPSAEQ